MYFSTLLAAVTTVIASANAQAACPAVWTDIGIALQNAFFDNTTLQCNDLARGAIRAAFHDCASWNISIGLTGGCDGSLVLDSEYTRSENEGLANISIFYESFFANFSGQGIGMADLIQFGAASAIVTCPLGPIVPTVVGRPDWTTAEPPNPEGLLPLASSNSTVLLDLFANKGISAAQLVALVGAHSTAKQFFFNTTFAGDSQDDSVGVWDVDFYNNTAFPLPPSSGVFVFPSDTALLNDPTTSATFRGFIGAQGKWNGAFKNAMAFLSTLGVNNTADLISCTSSLPPQKPLPAGVTKRDGFSFSARSIDPVKRANYQNFHKW